MTSRWTLTSGYQDLASLSAHNFISKLWVTNMVDVRVILLIKDDRINEYLCPHIELKTLRVYVCMYTMVTDASTKR